MRKSLQVPKIPEENVDETQSNNKGVQEAGQCIYFQELDLKLQEIHHRCQQNLANDYRYLAFAHELQNQSIFFQHQQILYGQSEMVNNQIPFGIYNQVCGINAFGVQKPNYPINYEEFTQIQNHKQNVRTSNSLIPDSTKKLIKKNKPKSLQCQPMTKGVLGGQRWNEQEDRLLIKYFKIYNGNWEEICKKIKGRNGSQCFQRWRRMHPNNRQCPKFSEADDALIIELVKQVGRKWVHLSKLLPKYKPKQIRDHFVNVLDESINKAEFTNEEDQLIINLYHHYGPKWKQIALQLNKRNDNDVKNRFYTQLRKRYFGIENRYQIVYNKN